MAAAGDQKVRPLVGGTRLESKPSFFRTLTATLGLVYANERFVTAGHAVPDVGEFIGQPENDEMVGRVETNYLEDGVDLALVEVLAGITYRLDAIWVGDGPTQPVTFETRQRPQQGENLWLQGALTGQVQCTVHATDVNINEPVSEQQLNNVVLLTLDADTEPGDSGAPVVGTANNLCYGIYGGRVVYEGTTYGWFTPFENVEWD